MTRTLTIPMNNSTEAAGLTEFGARLRRTNPFVINRVVQPSRNVADATTVHHSQFSQLVELAETACADDCSLGAVLWGEAGAGKSHLLGRLALWAEEEQRACFVYLQNLQANPENLPRSLLRATLSILTEGRQDRWHESRLYQLVSAALKAAFQQAGLTVTTPAEAERAYHNWLDRICSTNPWRAHLVEREAIYNIFFRFFESARNAKDGTLDGSVARLAVQWLSGDYLDPEQAQALKMRVSEGEESVALKDDEQIKRVLVALCHFADLRNQPFILCLDGVDGLEVEQIGKLTRFLHGLLDSAFNLLVITSGVESTLLEWCERGAIQKSTWDRIAHSRIVPLSRITPTEARQIVEVRLEQFLQPFVTLEPVRRRIHEDRLFPLGQLWFDEFLKEKIEIRPRDAIDWARQGWERQQCAMRAQGELQWLELWPSKTPPLSPPLPLPRTQLIDDKVDEKIAEHIADRQRNPERLPPDADNLAGLVSHLLGQCLGITGYGLGSVEQPVPPRRKKPAFQLLLRQRSADMGVLVLTAGEAARATTYALRNVVNEGHLPERFLLVTDQRRPLRLAAKGLEYQEQLRSRFGGLYQEHAVSFDQYAELDALQVVIGMARSGDLEIQAPPGQSRSISPDEVTQSHHRQDRYRKQPLLSLLLGQVSVSKPEPKKAEPTPPPSVQKEPPEGEFRQVIQGRLALMPGASSRELAEAAVAFFQKTRGLHLEPGVCQQHVEKAARKMAADGLVQVSDLPDGIYVMARRR